MSDTQDVTGSDVLTPDHEEIPMILTTDGDVIPLADFEPVEDDDTRITYVDSDGKTRRMKRSNYLAEDGI